jgi:DNA-binding MurR/RpiR family transcriptional regulator
MANQANGSCLARIRASMQTGLPATVAIGRFVLKSPFRARGMSIHELAKACGASAATVYRFCRELGYDGYRQYQLDLAAAVAQNDFATLEDFSRDIAPESIVRGVFEYNRQSLADTGRMLDVKALTRVAKLSQRARRVLFLGVGGSGLAAEYAAQRLLSLGLSAVAVRDPVTQILSTENVGSQDVVVGISHTGQTATIVEAVTSARRRGARTVSLTNYPKSRLAVAAEVRLITAFAEYRINAAISSSIIAQLSVIHSLYFILGGWGGEEARKVADDAERRSQRLLRARRTKNTK